MDNIAEKFERLAVAALIVLVMATILFGTAVVAWSLIDDLLHLQSLAVEPKALFDVFGLFVAVLVGVELLKVLRHLLQSHEVDTVLIVQTALLALCNKIIALNLHDTSWTTLLAVAGLIVALTAASYVLELGRK